ncbi:MAG: hypothetical protein LBB56_08555 [Chitinispirillales bacterium]|jgi:hypothetical protein|nr:hypothetical protein [Chitinispirillales bacterium]
MATENLGFGVTVDLENEEEILCKVVNDPKWKFGMTGPNDEGANTANVIAIYNKADNLKDTLISKFSFGLAGPKLSFQTHLVFTNKRLIVIPYANQKRTKEEMYTTRSLYYNKDIAGACAFMEANDTFYNECVSAHFKLTPVKGVNLNSLYFLLQLKLSKEELKAVSASMRKQVSDKNRVKNKIDKVNLLADKIEHDSFFDAFATQARVEAWKSKQKKSLNKKSVLGDKSILPLRDYLVWQINDAIAEAK